MYSGEERSSKKKKKTATEDEDYGFTEILADISDDEMLKKKEEYMNSLM